MVREPTQTMLGINYEDEPEIWAMEETKFLKAAEDKILHHVKRSSIQIPFTWLHSFTDLPYPYQYMSAYDPLLEV